MELIFFCILLVFAVITGVVLGLIEGAKHPEKYNKPRYTSYSTRPDDLDEELFGPTK